MKIEVRIGQYVSHFLEDSPIPGTEWTYEFAKNNLDAVKLENINGLINNFLHDENRVIVFTGPEKESVKKISEEQVLAVLADVKNSEIENADYETIRNYYKDWYRPGLMAVIVVGDLDVETIEQKIKSHFSNLEARENPVERKEYGVPNHDSTFVAIASDPEANFSQVSIYYKDMDEAEDVVTIADYKKQIDTNLAKVSFRV